ncbi:hypothetical protein Trebr_1717 [Treponema brennaborense DSM 12168]|uniref:Uncharacterized protein n=2 Tax=Treponema TaxID=157 RepID=F4LQ61_TREBD|nr:hypothetical protein Trebr_1717 [Treponema brennaborense DSM 12168]
MFVQTNRTVYYVFCFVIMLPVCFFLWSCGLDTYYYLEPPIIGSYVEKPVDPENRIFSFYTVQNTGNADVFLGTAVYYKIYNNESLVKSDMASVSSVNLQYSDAAMNRLRSLKYSPLASGQIGDEVLILKSFGSTSVRIRLFSENDYSATVTIGGTDYGIPLRTPLMKGFSFYPENDAAPVPAQGDSDVSYSASPTSADTWYVAAYAVSTGMNTELSPVYSQVLPLGYIMISKN